MQSEKRVTIRLVAISAYNGEAAILCYLNSASSPVHYSLPEIWESQQQVARHINF